MVATRKGGGGCNATKDNQGGYRVHLISASKKGCDDDDESQENNCHDVLTPMIELLDDGKSRRVIRILGLVRATS